MMNIWSLPGPAALLEEARRAAASNTHVVFVLPRAQHSRDICSSLRTWSSYFREVRVTGDGNLLDTLVETFGLPPGQPVSARHLWKHQPTSGAGLAGSIVWLNGVRPQEFQELAVELTALNASAQPYEHAILLTAVDCWDQPGHAAVRTLAWDDAVGLLDVQLLAAQLLRDRVPPPQLTFTSLLVAQLALYDLNLVPELARLPLEDLLRPESFLHGLAEQRGWKADTPASFEEGSLGIIDGAVRLHSARKALGGSLGRRVWRAQVAVLLPALEVRRQQLVQDYLDLIAPHLPLSREYKGRTTRVESPDDVEFTDMVCLAEKYGSRWPNGISATLRELAYMRNDLAHLQPLGRDAVERLCR